MKRFLVVGIRNDIVYCIRRLDVFYEFEDAVNCIRNDLIHEDEGNPQDVESILSGDLFTFSSFSETSWIIKDISDDLKQISTDQLEQEYHEIDNEICRRDRRVDSQSDFE